MAELITTDIRPDLIPDANIAAKINIEGLFILCVNWEKQIAQFGAYDLASSHNLIVKVFERPVQRDNSNLTSAIHYDPRIVLENLPMKDLHIDVPGAASELQLRFYKNSNLTDEEASLKDTEAELLVPDDQEEKMLDYRWITNLDHPSFHELFTIDQGQQVRLTPNVITRKIHIGHGILFTRDYNSRAITWAFESSAVGVSGQPPLRKLTYIAKELTILIPRDPSIKSITMASAPANGPITPAHPALSLPVTDTSFYDVRISNMCANEAAYDPRKHSDFHYYYNAIEIPVPQRIDIQPFGSGQGSNLAPCDPIYLGGTPEFP